MGGRALEQARLFAEENPKAPNPHLNQALQSLHRAVETGPEDGYAYRRLGQAYLLLGDNARAAEALSRATTLRPDHPLIWVELGYAYDGLGQTDRAIVAYERGRYGPALEAAIVNYIKVADWKTAAGGGDEALHILQDKVLVLDPDNLPALLRTMRIYEGMSEQAAQQFAEPLRQRLRAMSPDEVAVPTEPRLVEYTRQAMADLVAEGIWSE